MDNQEVYLNLASTNLQNNRQKRYDGSGFSISLDDIVSDDVSLILHVYQSLKGIYDLWLYMGENPNYRLLRDQLQKFDREFVMKARAIGMATCNSLDEPSPELDKAFHDIRGGALSSLTGYVQLISRLQEDEKLVRKAVFLARDHAKMMRNILPDLDPAIRAADEGLKIHSIDEFINKWNEVTIELDTSKSVTILAQSHLHCYITNRCLETSAVDRVLYNYINNAIRFSAGENICLTIIPIDNSITRWIVENEITQNQNAWLQETFKDQLSELFKGGYTRGGQGIGLSNCTDFVAATFGVSANEAIQEEYLGAKVHNNTYYAWFHWPIYLPAGENESICECSH